MAQNDPKIAGDTFYASEANYQAGNYLQLTAGENIDEEDAVYVKMSDGKVYQSDTATADDVRCTGFSRETVTSGSLVIIQTAGNLPTTGLTANKTYYLGATGGISTTRSAVQVGYSSSTTSLMIHVIQDDFEPVGTIRAYHPDLTGIPSNNVTAFWKPCDGSVVSDSESPLNGQTLPDLNGFKRFLRGGSTSGTLESDMVGPHDHDLTTRQVSANSSGLGGDPPGGSSITSSGTDTTSIQTNSGTETRPINMSVVWMIKIK